RRSGGGGGGQGGMGPLARSAAMTRPTGGGGGAPPWGGAGGGRAVAAASVPRARAGARRRESGLPPTSTMRTEPSAPTCDRSLTAVALSAEHRYPRGTPRGFPAGSSLVGKAASVGDGFGSKDARSPAGKVALREVCQPAAVAPRRLRPPAHPLSVQDAQRTPEGGGAQRPVRVPPRHRHPAAVGVDELHLRAG